MLTFIWIYLAWKLVEAVAEWLQREQELEWQAEHARRRAMMESDIAKWKMSEGARRYYSSLNTGEAL